MGGSGWAGIGAVGLRFANPTYGLIATQIVAPYRGGDVAPVGVTAQEAPVMPDVVRHPEGLWLHSVIVHTFHVVVLSSVRDVSLTPHRSPI